jgi:hypothetical protein
VNPLQNARRERRRFSIVIPHRDGRDMLAANLRRLRALSPPGVDEVFVVDNHSTDGSPEMVADSFPEVLLIRNGCNRGFGAACNQAISRARGELLLLLNNDALLSDGALDRLAEVFAGDARAAVVGGALVDPDGTPERSVRAIPSFRDEIGGGIWKKRRNVPQSAGKPVEVEAVPGACMAVRRAAVEEVGALDESFFFYFEDLDWCRRFREHGWKVYLQPAARVVHRPTSSRRTARAAQLEMLRARLVYYRRVYGRPFAWALELLRMARIAVNVVTQLVATAATLGRLPRHRRKLEDNAVLLGWWLSGKPETWGFPDRCDCREPESCPRRLAVVEERLEIRSIKG